MVVFHAVSIGGQIISGNWCCKLFITRHRKMVNIRIKIVKRLPSIPLRTLISFLPTRCGIIPEELKMARTSAGSTVAPPVPPPGECHRSSTPSSSTSSPTTTTSTNTALDKSLIEMLDSIVLMYNTSVHRQLSKVSGS